MKQITTGLTALFLSAALAGFAAPNQTSHARGQKHPAHAKKAVAQVKYKAHCGMIYSAADAKKYHYICPMDHKPLVKITSSAKTGQHMRMGK